MDALRTGRAAVTDLLDVDEVIGSGRVWRETEEGELLALRRHHRLRQQTNFSLNGFVFVYAFQRVRTESAVDDQMLAINALTLGDDCYHSAVIDNQTLNRSVLKSIESAIRRTCRNECEKKFVC